MASSASPKPRTRKTRGFLQMLIGHLKGREGQKEAEVWLHYKDQANRNGDQNWVARLQSDGKKGGQASWLETTLLQGQRWPPQGDDASKAEIMKTFWFESKIDDMAERKKNPANYAGIQPFHETRPQAILDPDWRAGAPGAAVIMPTPKKARAQKKKVEEADTPTTSSVGSPTALPKKPRASSKASNVMVVASEAS